MITKIEQEIYNKCSLVLSEIRVDTESKAYNACRFRLNKNYIICRDSKITPKKSGQFVFPKSELINKGIITTKKKGGKRGFRIYPEWDIATSKQAKKTQKWQLKYFFKLEENTNFNKVKELYAKKE